jgi:hypothetical protein
MKLMPNGSLKNSEHHLWWPVLSKKYCRSRNFSIVKIRRIVLATTGTEFFVASWDGKDSKGQSYGPYVLWQIGTITTFWA